MCTEHYTDITVNFFWTPQPEKAEPAADNAGDSSSDRTGRASPSHSVMTADLNDDLGDVNGSLGTIQDMEWQVFLQGNVMASMADEDLLKRHNGE